MTGSRSRRRMSSSRASISSSSRGARGCPSPCSSAARRFAGRTATATTPSLRRCKSASPRSGGVSRCTIRRRPGAGARAVLALLYPKEDPERIVDLPAIASTWDSDRDVALAELKKWQRVRDTAEAQIKAAMGEAESGYRPDGGRYTWRTVTREEYVAPATRYRQLRRLKT